MNLIKNETSGNISIYIYQFKYRNLNPTPPSIRLHLKIYLKILLQNVRMPPKKIIDLFNIDTNPKIL